MKTKENKIYEKVIDVLFERYKKDLSIYDSDYHRLVIDLEEGYLMYYLSSGKLTKEFREIYQEKQTSVTGQVNVNRKPFVYFRNKNTCWCLCTELEEILNQILT